MTQKQAFARALRLSRSFKALTQEDFSDISSRTYISSLERGLKSPTLEKIDAISETLQIHPLTLLTLAYLPKNMSDSNLTKLQNKITKQVLDIISSVDE